MKEMTGGIDAQINTVVDSGMERRARSIDILWQEALGDITWKPNQASHQLYADRAYSFFLGIQTFIHTIIGHVWQILPR
jgi:hypothetical protein